MLIEPSRTISKDKFMTQVNLKRKDFTPQWIKVFLDKYEQQITSHWILWINSLIIENTTMVLLRWKIIEEKGIKTAMLL